MQLLKFIFLSLLFVASSSCVGYGPGLSDRPIYCKPVESFEFIGIVVDVHTGEPIQGVTITVQDAQVSDFYCSGATPPPIQSITILANDRAFFHGTIDASPDRELIITISASGYQTRVIGPTTMVYIGTPYGEIGLFPIDNSPNFKK